MRRVIDAGPRSAQDTGSTGRASCTYAGSARPCTGGRCPHRAGPSGVLARMPSRRKPAPDQVTARPVMRQCRAGRLGQAKEQGMGTYAGAAAQDSDRMAADRAWVRWGMAAAVPTIMFTVTGVLGLRQAGLSPPWVPALGWLPAAAHVLVLFTLGPARPVRGGRDHRRARPAHHRHLDPRPGRHPAPIAAGSRPGHLRNWRVTKGTASREFQGVQGSGSPAPDSTWSRQTSSSPRCRPPQTRSRAGVPRRSPCPPMSATRRRSTPWRIRRIAEMAIGAVAGQRMTCHAIAASWPIVSMPYCGLGFPVLSTAIR